MAVNHLLELILRGEGFATSFSDEGDIGTEVDAPAKDSPENQGRQLVEKAKEKLREERRNRRMVISQTSNNVLRLKER